MKKGRYRRIVGLLITAIVCIGAIGAIIAFFPPQHWWARGVVFISSGLLAGSLVMLLSDNMRRGILAGIGVGAILAFRFFELDTVLNVVLVLGILGTAEVYFRT